MLDERDAAIDNVQIGDLARNREGFKMLKVH